MVVGRTSKQSEQSSNCNQIYLFRISFGIEWDLSTGRVAICFIDMSSSKANA